MIADKILLICSFRTIPRYVLYGFIEKVTLSSALLFFLWFDKYYDSYLRKWAYDYFKLLNSFFNTQLLFNRLIILTSIVIATILHFSTFEFEFHWLVITADLLLPCQLLPCQGFHCNSMVIGNYSTFLIGDSIIAGLSLYSNIWRKYF